MTKYKGLSYKKVGTANKNEKLEHRILAEKVLGHELPKGAVIHHVNGGIDGPIVICESQAYHLFLHIRMRAYKESGDANKRKCPICYQWDYVDNMRLTRGPRNCISYRHSGCDNNRRRSRRNMLKNARAEDFENDVTSKDNDQFQV